ncbi:MAG: YbhB/YbcL family Raf kinase inhibitor-like protein [bacterium]|nr:YbhB/YbcL family Raf kinase inhibitor-like protein [bacterium]
MPMSLTSPAFATGGNIPRRYTGDGANLSPALTWSDLPPTAAELALIVDDPDAPGRSPWVHWLVYKIPRCAAGLAEGVPHTPLLADPPGAFQGMNGWGQLGYGGPAPPERHGPHHYRFRLFALSRTLDVFHGLRRKCLDEALSGCTLEVAELVGVYQR